jgi:protein SCO1/2
MAYTSCVYACPRIIAEMKRIEAALADADPERAPGFVLFSIDPARDTPARLADFADETGLDSARWTLLTGPDEQVLELSVLLGVKYRATESGDFAHSNLVTVLDREGVVRARIEGLDTDVTPAVEALRELAALPRLGS